MEFEGVVYKVLPPVKGTSARGEWTKQEVVFDLPGEFNRKVCVSFWGDRALDAGSLHEGEQILVSINLESREHNGRWYTEARAWKMARKGAAAPSPAPSSQYQAPDGGAFANEEPDDLPF